MVGFGDVFDCGIFVRSSVEREEKDEEEKGTNSTVNQEDSDKFYSPDASLLTKEEDTPMQPTEDNPSETIEEPPKIIVPSPKRRKSLRKFSLNNTLLFFSYFLFNRSNSISSSFKSTFSVGFNHQNKRKCFGGW